MSDPMRPTKLSRRVYIRRRIAVLLGLLALIIVVVMIVAGQERVASWFGASTDSSAALSDPQPAPASGKESEELTPPTEPQDCSPSDLSVEAVTDSTNYGPDDIPKFSLRVTNHGETACNADLGTATMVFEVHSGAELYWSSTDCQKDSETTLVQVAPGQTLESESLEWSRERSSPETCDIERTPAPADGASYHLTAEIAGVTSEKSRQFLLH